MQCSLISVLHLITTRTRRRLALWCDTTRRVHIHAGKHGDYRCACLPAIGLSQFGSAVVTPPTPIRTRDPHKKRGRLPITEASAADSGVRQPMTIVRNMRHRRLANKSAGALYPRTHFSMAGLAFPADRRAGGRACFYYPGMKVIHLAAEPTARLNRVAGNLIFPAVTLLMSGGNISGSTHSFVFSCLSWLFHRE